MAFFSMKLFAKCICLITILKTPACVSPSISSELWVWLCVFMDWRYDHKKGSLRPVEIFLIEMIDYCILRLMSFCTKFSIATGNSTRRFVHVTAVGNIWWLFRFSGSVRRSYTSTYNRGFNKDCAITWFVATCPSRLCSIYYFCYMCLVDFYMWCCLSRETNFSTALTKKMF